MLKSVAKTLLMFVGTAILALTAAIVSYIITKNSYETRLQVAKSQAAINTATNQTETTPSPDNKTATQQFDYYVVRLEGESLNVYASQGGNEEFLYNESIYTNDLSQDDRALLDTGVMLENSEALTGFIENFTS